jgi:undecaprenyl diphosphate synthase
MVALVKESGFCAGVRYAGEHTEKEGAMNSINHVGIIMDGNRRWAKAQRLDSFKGHDKGADVFVDTCEWCGDNKIKYLTVYAFSTENWQRAPLEVAHLFGLLENFFTEKISHCLEKGIRIRVIGERAHFDKKTLAVIEKAEAQTAHCENLFVQIALSYGGRDEITRAVKKIVADVGLQKIAAADISEDVFAQYLDTAGLPDVDLVIRTGGSENRRLSNFLPWQTVYAEFYFSDLLWPDFSQEEFNKALAYYAAIPRKQGK